MKLKRKFSIISTVFLAVCLYPGFVPAQAMAVAESSISISSIFLKIVNWGLVILFLFGILLMPIAGFSWYKKNQADHTWIDFFKSGSFILRFIIIIAAFILWYFKVIERIIQSV